MLLRFSLGMTTALLVLTGCNPQPNDVRFAPVYPQVAQTSENRTGSMYSDGTANSLFADSTARRVGDILTINLVENTSGKKTASTKGDTTTSVDVANPTLLGSTPSFDNSRKNLAVKLDKTNSYEGDGESDQSNSLSGSITVTVAQVLANGNLVVRGEKWIHINTGKEYIRLTGIVRPADVDENNSVESTKVANARIAYSGTGQVAETNKSGWLTRFFMGALGGLFPW